MQNLLVLRGVIALLWLLGKPSQVLAVLSLKGPTTFEQAKGFLNQAMAKSQDSPRTWYCNCLIESRQVLNCDVGVPTRKPLTLEWDHVVPAAAFPKPEICRSIDGSQRNCARQRSQAFRYAEADLVNLVPAESQVNQLKSSKLPGLDETRFTSRCGFEVGIHRFNPPPHKKGDFARIWFHMNKKHFEGKLLSLNLAPLLFKWNREDPISPEEGLRAKNLAKLGSAHLFVRD